MQIRKLLYATAVRQQKFSEAQRFMELRTLGLEEVIFLHATKVKGRDIWRHDLVPKQSSEFETAVLDAEDGINSRAFVVEGQMVRSILDVAHREKVSLIAASLTRDVSGWVRRSMTKDLLRSTRVPLIILPENLEAPGSAQEGMFTHVIFAADWSAASEKAMSYILNFKDIIKELEIVHVIDKKLSVRDMGKLKEALSKTRNVFLDHGIDAEAHVYAGKPFEEIMLAARDYDATCICMGTAGKSFVKGLLSRSCACRVAETSVVPTLVVP